MLKTHDFRFFIANFLFKFFILAFRQYATMLYAILLQGYAIFMKLYFPFNYKTETYTNKNVSLVSTIRMMAAKSQDLRTHRYHYQF